MFVEIERTSAYRVKTKQKWILTHATHCESQKDKHILMERTSVSDPIFKNAFHSSEFGLKKNFIFLTQNRWDSVWNDLIRIENIIWTLLSKFLAKQFSLNHVVILTAKLEDY